MNSAERHEARYQRRKAAREAKRRKRLDVYDDFDRVASIQSLIRANFDSRKGVMWKASVARYNAHFLKFAVMQSRDLYTGKFKCSGFFVFWIVERGKRRHVHSLHYAERVIRRSFCINALVPILSSGLIYDNGASLKGKGVAFAVNRCAVHQYICISISEKQAVTRATSSSSTLKVTLTTFCTSLSWRSLIGTLRIWH